MSRRQPSLGSNGASQSSNQNNNIHNYRTNNIRMGPPATSHKNANNEPRWLTLTSPDTNMIQSYPNDSLQREGINNNSNDKTNGWRTGQRMIRNRIRMSHRKPSRSIKSPRDKGRDNDDDDDAAHIRALSPPDVEKKKFTFDNVVGTDGDYDSDDDHDNDHEQYYDATEYQYHDSNGYPESSVHAIVSDRSSGSSSSYSHTRLRKPSPGPSAICIGSNNNNNNNNSQSKSMAHQLSSSTMATATSAQSSQRAETSFRHPRPQPRAFFSSDEVQLKHRQAIEQQLRILRSQISEGSDGTEPSNLYVKHSKKHFRSDEESQSSSIDMSGSVTHNRSSRRMISPGSQGMTEQVRHAVSRTSSTSSTMQHQQQQQQQFQQHAYEHQTLSTKLLSSPQHSSPAAGTLISTAATTGADQNISQSTVTDTEPVTPRTRELATAKLVRDNGSDEEREKAETTTREMHSAVNHNRSSSRKQSGSDVASTALVKASTGSPSPEAAPVGVSSGAKTVAPPISFFRKTNRIKLHVYDLVSNDTQLDVYGCYFPLGRFFNALNSSLHSLGTGAYHVGVEVSRII
jgi:hypothetical protein